MKDLKAWVTLLPFAAFVCLLSAIPVSAGTILYDNGPVNGTVSAWTINGGNEVSNSFTLKSAGTRAKCNSKYG
jgi:hypothetical protein